MFTELHWTLILLCDTRRLHCPKPFRPVTRHHRDSVIWLVSIPFHQQKPKQIAHVVERITPKPTRFEFFHDQASLPWHNVSAYYRFGQSRAQNDPLTFCPPTMPPSRSDDCVTALMDLMVSENSPSCSPKKLRCVRA